jgi:hypothetical protein
MRNRLLALGACVLAALALAACGGGDNSEDQDQITKAIELAATSGDPSACTQVETVNFLQQTSGGGGGSAEQAVKQCEQDAKDSVADEVDVDDIEVDDSSATANAAVTGSIFDGQTLQIALVKEGDQWKLDQFKGFEDFDRNSLNAAFKEEIASDPETPPAAVDCVTQQIDSASDQDLEGLFVGNDPKAEEAIFGPCSKFFQGE